jgi:hypothetical protein
MTNLSRHYVNTLEAHETMKRHSIAGSIKNCFTTLKERLPTVREETWILGTELDFNKALHPLRSCARTCNIALAAPLMLLGLASASALPAAAQNLQNFNLLWNSYSSSLQISGVITLDLDLLDPAQPTPSPLPYGPAGLPPWVHALSITVPGSGIGTGSFDLSDYTELDWQINNTIDFDFTTELIGQGGWGTTCNIFPDTAGYCNFRLITDPATTDAPYGDIGFQMYTAAGGGQYGGMVDFTPAGPAPPVPAPLPLAGAAVMLHGSRRLRRRVNASATKSHRITP